MRKIQNESTIVNIFSVYKTKLLKSSTKHKNYNRYAFTATNNPLNNY